jgi:hypothetical protein
MKTITDSDRVSFTSSEGTGTWEFVYDTTAGIPAVIEEVHSGSVYYIREPNGALIARVVGKPQLIGRLVICSGGFG